MSAFGDSGANYIPLKRPWFPYWQDGAPESERDEWMYDNAKIFEIYRHLVYPRKNQLDYSVTNPATATHNGVREAVAVYRGRGQQVEFTPLMQPSRPRGCLPPVPYVPIGNYAQYVNRPGYFGGWYRYLEETDAMYAALPTGKVGVQQSLTFCLNAECRPQ
jgi:hypothetical protein